MSEFSTSECKEFLAENFPLSEKGWKRVKKFKDNVGNTLREFAHSDISETVFLMEINGDLRLSHDASPHNCVAFKQRMARLCTFTIIDDLDEGPRFGRHLLTLETIDVDGETTDDYMPLLTYIFPSDWKTDAEMECQWMIENGLNEDDTLVALHDWGFQSNQEFDNEHSYGNPRSAWNCAALVARNQKYVLQQNLGSTNVPSSATSKI